MKKILLIITFLNLILNGQDYPFQITSTEISNVSGPNVSSFARFKEAPIEHYSGRTNNSIPIYTINVGNISYPISINYASGGIQVNTQSSDVGLGWSLSSTFVNRTIVGDADWETFPSGPLEAGCVHFDLNKSKTGFLNRAGPTTHFTTNMDYYPDIFKFYSPNSKSSFYFPNKTSVIELDKKGSKINWSTSTKKYDYLSSAGQPVNNNLCLTDYDNFDITTKDGLNYFFDNKDIFHSFQSGSGGVYNDFGKIAGTFPRVATWHVSKIKDNLTNEEINFTYEEYSTENTNDISTILNSHFSYRFETQLPNNIIGNFCFLPFDSSSSDDAGKYYNRMLSVKRLKKITFRNGTVNFNYGLNRTDLNNGKALTNITIKDINNKVIKQFDFEYGYFNSDIQINEFSNRLKLLSVKETGKNKYQFDYFQESNLPNIGSLYQDFFGYNNQTEILFNNNNFGPANNKNYSKYYFYPNKKEFSILPYNISTDNNHYLLNGSINKEPNQLSKIWSLKKITFPTGGSVEFDLESNEFGLWGVNLKGGGTRIKNQIIKENNSAIPRIVNYIYKTNTGASTGYLLNVPYAGHPASPLFDVMDTNPNLSNITNLQDYFFLYTNSKLNYDLLNNFFIGYSKIEENEGGKKTIYDFTNEEYLNEQTRTHYTAQGVTLFSSHCMSPFLNLNSAMGNNIYIDKSHLRGRLKLISYYDDSNNLIKKIENIFSSHNVIGTTNSLDEIYFSGANVIQKPNTSGDNNTDFAEIIESKKGYISIYNNVTKTKNTNYLSNGNIVEENEYLFDDKQNVTFQGKILDEGTYYPYYKSWEFYHPYHPTFNNDVGAQNLISLNKINVPLRVDNYEGQIDFIGQNQTISTLLNSSKTLFKRNMSSSNLTLPDKTQYLSFKTNQYEDQMLYDLYDNKGNLIQYRMSSSNIPTVILYGYNQTVPIAKIEGATFEQVMQAMGLPTTNNSYINLSICNLSNQDVDATTEQQLVNALNDFRKNAGLANYMITTYTYDPLIGVTNIIPPSGLKEKYIYDTANRLEKVVDVNGNIVKEYSYHYKQ